jgi:hypothetical protein
MRYVARVSKIEKDPLDRWRHHEAEYRAVAAPFLDVADAGDAPMLDKTTLLELVRLRDKADRWREKYFAATYRD